MHMIWALYPSQGPPVIALPTVLSLDYVVHDKKLKRMIKRASERKAATIAPSPRLKPTLASANEDSTADCESPQLRGLSEAESELHGLFFDELHQASADARTVRRCPLCAGEERRATPIAGSTQVAHARLGPSKWPIAQALATGVVRIGARK